MGHFVSSPKEREKRDRRDSRGDQRERQGRRKNRNEREETEEIKTSPLYPYLLQGQQALPNCKPISDGRPSDVGNTCLSKTGCCLTLLESSLHKIRIAKCFELLIHMVQGAKC